MHRCPWLTLVLPAVLSFAGIPLSMAEVASISIDWSKLQTQTVPILGLPAPVFAYSSQSTRLTTRADTPGDGSEAQDHAFADWSTPRNLGAHTTNADGTASANGAALSVNVSATSPSSGFCCGSSSNAMVDRSAGFSLSGPGSLIFSVPYTLSASGDNFDFFNQSSASIEGSISFNSNDGNFSRSTRTVAAGLFSNGPSSQSGTLVIGIVADAAGSGSMDIQLSASAGEFSGFFIPEPSLFLELAAGFGAIAAVGRRRIAFAAKAV